MTVLADADFYAPLVSNVNLSKGSGIAAVTRATTAGIVDSVTGLLTTSAINTIRHDSQYGALLNSSSRTNNLLWCRELASHVSPAAGSAWVNSVAGGAEIITNGSFDTDLSGWSAGGGSGSSITWNAGKVECASGASSNELVKQSVTLVVGKTYHVSADIAAASQSIAVYVQGITLKQSIFSSATNKRQLTFVADKAASTLLIVGGGANATATIDNVTLKLADVQVSVTATGIDGQSNSCSLLTAGIANAVILQTITAVAIAACSSFYVKRSVGSGSIYFTRDGGATWLDITSQINSSTFTRVKIENTSVTNPQVGFKIATSGDAIIVDYGQNEAGTECSMPILTTTAAATRNTDGLTYQTSGNFSDTAGTILATVRRENWANNNGSAVGSATRGLYTSSSNSGAQALDGTNTVNGPAGSVITQRKIGLKYSGSSLKVFSGGNFGASGSYDGSFNLSTIAIMPGTNGYVRDVAIWQSSLSDADMLSAASDQSDFNAAGVGGAAFNDNFIYNSDFNASGVGAATFLDSFIYNSDFNASGAGVAVFSNNWVCKSDFNAAGVGSADFISNRLLDILLSSQEIKITYYQPTITISI